MFVLKRKNRVFRLKKCIIDLRQLNNNDFFCMIKRPRIFLDLVLACVKTTKYSLFYMLFFLVQRYLSHFSGFLKFFLLLVYSQFKKVEFRVSPLQKKIESFQCLQVKKKAFQLPCHIAYICSSLT